ncbi:putative receptor protein kinase ZmPK1 [Magnolia sinica]|uniref:putative receptor protein kinase ZmPK1 n=1 Tax=Magnolia sinica TaxID=86752 RepID=UPI002659BB8F|nr:putative receptor protein kinase ZmPK1 [Magnolia sinica]
MESLLLSSFIALTAFLSFTDEAWASVGIRGLQTLKQGGSLSVERENDFLVSLNGSFSSGFFKVGINAYCYSIWFTNSAEGTVAWMANRDHPVNGKLSELTLQGNGNLVLTDADGTTVWGTNTYSQTAVEAQLLETGNLVLKNHVGEIIWESFDSPMDTLLPSQLLTKTSMLVSKRSQSTYLSGYYNFHFRDDNVLSLIYNSPQISSLYWPNPDLTVFQSNRTTYNSSRVAVLNEMGHFRSSDSLKFDATDYGVGPKRRLTLDYDGILRLYSLNESSGDWTISWSPNLDTCRVHGLCGRNGICHYTPSPACTCPPGFNMTDPSDWSIGCSSRFNQTCNPAELGFMQLYNTDYYGYDLASYGVGMTFEACRNTCLNDCQCTAFGYSFDGKGQCFPKGILLNGYHMPNSPRIMYIKVPSQAILHGDSTMSNIPHLSCSDKNLVLGNETSRDVTEYSHMKYLIGFVAAFGLVEMVSIAMGWWYIRQTHGNAEAVDIGYLAVAMGFKRFSYAELKAATRNFREEIGRGGFGKVYKGVLDNNRIVAVKRLEGMLQGEAEFWAEVSIIGRINHMNLVKMWGFCTEEKHKLLVYEYLEKGSLDKILFSDLGRQLKWDQRFNIALGGAKGLSYLHEECLEWVLHCDVKPQNILLDGHFEPKVADFGMSKLVRKCAHNSSFSRVRGTRGYLAPEWMMNQQIDAKVDVYSYGIVLLELVSGRSVSSIRPDGCRENVYGDLIQWVKEAIKRRDGIMEVADPRLDGEYDIKKIERLVMVALMCAKEDKDKRPAMSEVVELLLGDGGEGSYSARGD